MKPLERLLTQINGAMPAFRVTSP